MVNEFDSYDSSMDVLVNGQKVSKGDLVLHAYGFDFGGEPFGKSWIGWTFIYLIPYIVLSTLCLGLGLAIFRVEAVSISDKNKDRARDELKNIKGDSQAVNFPFSPVNLAFINICYSVNTSSGPLRLLNDVSGYLAAGRMIALMGSSGAGKTTLLVSALYLRKRQRWVCSTFFTLMISVYSTC